MLRASFSAYDPKQTWNGAANQAERGERAFTSRLVHIAQRHQWTDLGKPIPAYKPIGARSLRGRSTGNYSLIDFVRLELYANQTNKLYSSLHQCRLNGGKRAFTRVIMAIFESMDSTCRYAGLPRQFSS